MKVESWYDRHTKSWVVQMVDDNWNQIGSAEYCGTKEDRDYCVQQMEKSMEKIENVKAHQTRVAKYLTDKQIKEVIENSEKVANEHKIKSTTSIQQIRAMTGLNKTDFAKRYNIPFRTVQNWELGTRECPEYVLELLERVAREDFKVK